MTTVGTTRGAFNPPPDPDLSGILRRLGQPQLLINLDPTAHPDETINPGQPISLISRIYDPLSTISTDALTPSQRYSSFQISFFDRGNRIFGPTTQRTLSILPGA